MEEEELEEDQLEEDDWNSMVDQRKEEDKIHVIIDEFYL